MSPVSRHARRSAAAAAVGALALSGLVGLNAAPAQGFDPSCDPPRPVLKTLKVSPTRVNVKSGERTVVVSGTTSGPALGLVSVTANPVREGHDRYGETAKTKGNKFKVTISVPKGASNGRHNLGVTLTSKDDRSDYFGRKQLIERGLPHRFYAVSEPDLKAPKLTRIRLSEKSVNTTRKTAKVTVTAKGFDRGGSGLEGARVLIGSKHLSTYVDLTRKKKGVLTGTAIIPTWAGRKTATVRHASVRDKAGNYTSYGKYVNTKELTRPLKPRLKVRSKTDTADPVVKSAWSTPSTVKVGERQREVEFAVKVADSQSGVDSVSVELPLNMDHAPYSDYETYLTKKKGTWRGTTTIPCGTLQGTFDIEVTAHDRSGRWTVTRKGTVTFTE
ncbi:hypothetical protein [Nocardioides gilvus]|uniref:hypothetical protein n=1 Tax=Nocardioides gilvus TaxID=1735589 RepID=UPI000D744EC1|nr:hypothetical protein [Nocardioides gilvus]